MQILTSVLSKNLISCTLVFLSIYRTNTGSPEGVVMGVRHCTTVYLLYMHYNRLIISSDY